MKIEGKGPGPTPAERIPAVTARDGNDAAKKAAGEDRRTDRVEISAAGRAKNDVGDVSPVPADQPDRLDQVRARVQSGFYETEEVQVAVARQLVARGDHRS